MILQNGGVLWRKKKVIIALRGLNSDCIVMYVLWSGVKIVWIIPVFLNFSAPSRLLNIYKDVFFLKKKNPQRGCVSKLTIKNRKRYILLTGISIVIPNSEGDCIIETDALQKWKRAEKKPKGSKFFPLSNSYCLPICFISIQSFLSFISAFVNPISFDLTCRSYRHSLHLLQWLPSFRVYRASVSRGSAENAGEAGSGWGAAVGKALPSSATPSWSVPQQRESFWRMLTLNRSSLQSVWKSNRFDLAFWMGVHLGLVKSWTIFMRKRTDTHLILLCCVSSPSIESSKNWSSLTKLR